MADVSNIVTVNIQAGQSLFGNANINACCLMTSDEALSSVERFATFNKLSDVGGVFGTTSAVYDYASVFFAQNPNPTAANGYLIVGRWRSVAEDLPASGAKLEGAFINSDDVYNELLKISDGEFDITIDGTLVNATGMDFTTIGNIDEAALVIAGAVGHSTSFNNEDGQFRIFSSTTGASSTITFVTDPGTSGTYVGALFGFENGQGGAAVQGADASTLPLETKVDALTAVKEATDAYGFTFVDLLSDADVPLIANWVTANNALYYHVFSGSSYLSRSTSNPAWVVRTSGQKKFRMFYSNTNNQKIATAFMSRGHTSDVNFENTALTMNLKVLQSITPDDIDDSTLLNTNVIGMDVYTTITKGDQVLSGVIQSGANGWWDQEYYTLALSDGVTTALCNLLLATVYKVPQTIKGSNRLVDTCEKLLRRYVRFGFIAPGTWSSTDYFGDQVTFNRNIEENGFYVLAGRWSDQSQSDREARKSVPIQIAVKLAGAIHTVIINVLINQ